MKPASAELPTGLNVPAAAEDSYSDGLAVPRQSNNVVPLHEAHEGEFQPPRDLPANISRCPMGGADYICDVPYTDSTFRLKLYGEVAVSQEDIQGKVSPITAAISKYIPVNDFLSWVEEFNEQFQEPERHEAIVTSLKHILAQFNSGENANQVALPEALRACIEAGDPDVLRAVLKHSSFFYQAPNHPELLVSFALWQSAYPSYLGRLGIALAGGPLEQFAEFNIYGLLTPLTLFKRENILAEGDSGSSPEQVMLAAITQARQQFIKSHSMTRIYEDGDVEVCPAYRHMLAVLKTGIMEKQYQFVLNASDEPAMRALTAVARETAEEALRHREYYALLSIGREVLRAAHERGGKGLFLDGPPDIAEVRRRYLATAARLVPSPKTSAGVS